MATALEIARGISQVMANVHDGALDESGDPISIGLKREEDVSVHDRRLMDGFKVALYGDHLGLGLTTVGLVLLCARIFDTVTDPIVGYLSDRIGFKGAHRKPWITKLMWW